MDIRTTVDEVGPGDNVDIAISAKPNSYVGILGVDQRSLILKSGNDLTHVNNQTNLNFSYKMYYFNFQICRIKCDESCCFMI